MATLIAENSREAIINASLLLFYRDGISTTTVPRIAREAGLPEREFYQDFASKDDVVAAFLHRRHEIWFAWFKAEVEFRLAGEGHGLEVIADVLQIWFEDPSFRGCAFINTFAEAASVTAEALSISREAKEELKHYLADVARRLNLKEPQTAAAAAVMVIEGAIVRAQMTGNPTEVYNARLLFQCLNHA